jgi:hypothetical protein
MALALALASGSARAELVLVFDDPGTSEIDYLIEDQGELDRADSEGVIQYVIDERPTGLYAIATAISKPVIPFLGEGDLGILENELILSVLAFRYPGSLIIGLTDTDYDFPLPSVGVASITGGFIGGSSIDFIFFGDTDNEEFGRGFEITSFGPIDFPEPDINILDIEGRAEPVGSLSMMALAVEGEGENLDVHGTLDMVLELVGGQIECTVNADCDDELFCTGAEFCVHGTCVQGDPPCIPGEICHEELGECEPGELCEEDRDCDDGIFCNGQETCTCFGAEDDCPSNKVLVCHIPRGNPGNSHEICVGSAAVNAHLNHGDELGACRELCQCSSGPPPCDEDETCDEELEICMDPSSRTWRSQGFRQERK